jgi:hypothetical protein
MSEHKSNDGFHLGFLRVAEVDGGGYVGGILVTSVLGRPLEFQCTTPVRPNRTQVILYGPTLAPFLYCEVIGKTLLERLGVKPDLVLVDQEPLLELRRHATIPVACIVPADPERRELPDVTRRQVGRQLLWFHPDFPQDNDAVAERCARVPADADLCEPLERVSDALQETLRAGAVA